MSGILVDLIKKVFELKLKVVTDADICSLCDKNLKTCQKKCLKYSQNMMS